MISKGSSAGIIKEISRGRDK